MGYCGLLRSDSQAKIWGSQNSFFVFPCHTLSQTILEQMFQTNTNDCVRTVNWTHSVKIYFDIGYKNRKLKINIWVDALQIRLWSIVSLPSYIHITVQG